MNTEVSVSVALLFSFKVQTVGPKNTLHISIRQAVAPLCCSVSIYMLFSLLLFFFAVVSSYISLQGVAERVLGARYLETT